MTMTDIESLIIKLQAQVSLFQDQLSELKEKEAISSEVSPLPEAFFSPSSYTASEHTGVSTLVTVKVELSTSPGETVTVDYQTSDGTATAGQDYQSVSGTLIFSPEQTSKTFTMYVLDDDITEPDETVYFKLSNPKNGTLGAPSQATLTIKDNDALPKVRFSKFVYSVTEGGTATVKVKLSAAFTKTVKVDFQTSDGTAKAGQDYESVSRTLTFDPGEVSQAIDIATIDDDIIEYNEVFFASLTNPINATLGIPKNSTLIIKDDDEPLGDDPRIYFDKLIYSTIEGGSYSVKVRLSKSSNKYIYVTYYTNDGTAKAGQDYEGIEEELMFRPGETVKTIRVNTIDDNIDEISELFTLNLGVPVNALLGKTRKTTLVIVDNDGSSMPKVSFSKLIYSVTEGGIATIKVKLSETLDETVSVDYATYNGTAKAGQDYQSTSGTLIFSSGQTSRTFQVTTIDDDIPEGSETLKLKLSNPVNAELGIPKQSTLIIKDNETPKARFGKFVYSEMEGDVVTIKVKLSESSDKTISVDYATFNGTAIAGEDYLSVNGTLTFSPGQTSRTFQIVTIEDNIPENNEILKIKLSNPVNATLGIPSVTFLIIKDDDTVPKVRFNKSVYSVKEGKIALITAKLSVRSNKTVKVDYQTSDGTAEAGQDYESTSGTLTFIPRKKYKIFFVKTLSDNIPESNETVDLTLSNPVNATLGTLHEATLTIKDQWE